VQRRWRGRAHIPSVGAQRKRGLQMTVVRDPTKQTSVSVGCREGDLVTMTEKQDVQQAMAEVLEAAERTAPPGAARTLPLQHLITATPLRLKLIPVASEARLDVL